MMLHWMYSHGTSVIPPNFKCKQINKYRDSLSRQIGEAVWIITDGNLNNKNEYGINHLCRLVDDKIGWEAENDYIEQEKERKREKADIREFIRMLHNVKETCSVMSNRNVMLNVDQLNCSTSTNQDLCCRSERAKEVKRKRKRTSSSSHSTAASSYSHSTATSSSSHSTATSSSSHSTATSALEKMDFSTPCDHRTAPMVLDEEESPILASVDTGNKIVSWELLPGDIESMNSELAPPSKTGNSREMDVMALTPTKRVETSQDFENGANTYMDLAMRKNILHNSLPADLNIMRPRRGSESNDLMEDEFIQMIEGLNLENWSMWSGNDSLGSPERVKRLESFLIEWNSGNDQIIIDHNECALTDSNGSIINNLAGKDVKIDVLARENISPPTLEDVVVAKDECNDAGVNDSGTVKKRLIFGKNAPLHILQQKGTPESVRVVKRKKNLTQDLNETPGKKKRTTVADHTDTIGDARKNIDNKKGRRKKEKRFPVPQNQPLISTVMKKSNKSSTRSNEM